jgi:hypothetical protein
MNATWPITAIPQLRRLVPDFPPRRPGFVPRSDHVTCAGSSPITSVSPDKSHSANCSTSLFILSSTLYSLDVSTRLNILCLDEKYELWSFSVWNLFRVPQHNNELMNNVLNCLHVWKVRRDTVRQWLRITRSYSSDSSIWKSHVFSLLHLKRPEGPSRDSYKGNKLQCYIFTWYIYNVYNNN